MIKGIYKQFVQIIIQKQIFPEILKVLKNIHQIISRNQKHYIKK